MSGVQIPVEAKLSAGDLDKVLGQLTEQINKLGARVAEVNKIKFNPIDKATLEDLQKVQTQFGSLLKIGNDFRRRMKDTGQSGQGFFDLDFSRMYVDPTQRARQMQKAFNYVTAGTGASFTMPAAPTPAPANPAPGGSGGGGGGGSRNPPPRTPGTTWGSAGRKIISSGLRAAGPVGGVADSALSSGLAGGAVAGLAGLAGGLVALGVGKAISSVMEKIGDAQKEDIGYDTLKRQLGDVNVSFEALQEGLRAAAGSIGVTFNEAQKLGSEFTRLSGITDKQSTQLASEVGIAGGFGRSFGLDPSQAVAFFAQMRQVGITSNAQDSQKLAITVAEAIAKSGAFSRVGEVLESISSFATQQTRLGLTAANTTGYAGALVGLMNEHLPGLDVRGSANLLSRANGAIMPGGGSDAFQNLIYRALGQSQGLDPIQTRILQEQGLFGTAAQAFGKGSAAEQYGIRVPGSALSSGKTNLELIMGHFREIYRNQPHGDELMADALHKNFNLSYGQAMAFSKMQPARLGGLLRRLQRLGIDPGSVSDSGLSRLSHIEADKGLTEAQKDQQEKSVAMQNQQATKGSEVRDSVVGVQNKLQELADKAVPLLTDMRDVMLYAFGNRGAITSADIHKAVIDGQKKTVNDRADARIADIKSQYGKDIGQLHISNAARDAYGAKANSDIAAINTDRDASLAQISASGLDISPTLATKAGSWAVDAAMSGQQKYGVPAAVTLAQYGLESGYGTSGIAKAANNPFGIHAADGQDFIMGTDIDPKTGKRVPTKFRRFKSIAEAFDAHAKLLATNSAYSEARKYTNDPMAYADALTGHYATDPMYGTKLKQLMRDGMYSTPMPDGAPASTAPQKHEVSVNVNGDFTLNHPSGAPAAAPVSVQTQVGTPQAAGTR